MNESRLNELQERFASANSLSDLTEMSQAVRLSAEEIQVENAVQMMYGIIDRMIENTTADIELLYDAIIFGLMPWCLPIHPGLASSPQYSVHRYRFQESLAKWINQFALEEKFEIRNRVLEYLEESSKRAPTADQLYVVGSIGFRTQSIDAIIWDLVQTESELADEALSTAVGLGTPVDSRHKILDMVQAILEQGRITKGCTYAIHELVGPTRVEIAVQLAEMVRYKFPERNSWDYHTCLGAVTKAVSRCHENDPAHERIWQLVREDAFVVEFTSDLAFRCNTEMVLPDLRRFITEAQEQKANEIRVYRLFDRVFEVGKPRQLLGWVQIATPEFIGVVRSLATRDTKISGIYGTLERGTKKRAWECLIAIENEVREIDILTGITEESNGYVSHEIAELVSGATIKAVPDSILLSIQEESVDANEHEDFLRRKGYMNIATTCGSRSCFDAMTKFSVTRNGQVLRTTVDSLMALAKFRQRDGDTDVKETIWRMTQPNRPKHQREAGIAVFCRLIEEYREEDAERLWQFIRSESVDEFSKSEALRALGHIKTPLNETSVALLNSYVKNQSGDLGWRACEFLLQVNELNVLNNEIVLKRLNLSIDEDLVRANDLASITSWQAYLIGQLFRRNPIRFQDLICQIVEGSPEKCLYQLIQVFRHLGEGCPEVVVQSLMLRVRRENNEFVTDTSLITVLATISPRLLIEELSQGSVVEWMVEARVAICECLFEIASKRSEFRNLVIKSIEKFVLDASFAVRRSALRTLSKLDSGRLFDLCSKWKTAPNIEFRKRAAQACEWLPIEEFTDEQVVALGLDWDVEATVRDVSKRVLENRWRRHWAELYTQNIVRAATIASADSICNARKYGHALARFGDDETIRALESFLESSTVEPHIANWIVTLLKELKKQWKKTIESFPEPWYHESGQIEQLIGTVLFGDKEFAAEITLWCRHRTTQSDLGEWGCTVVARIPMSETFSTTKSMELRLPNRRMATAKVFASSYSNDGSTFTLFGQSDYPEKLD